MRGQENGGIPARTGEKAGRGQEMGVYHELYTQKSATGGQKCKKVARNGQLFYKNGAGRPIMFKRLLFVIPLPPDGEAEGDQQRDGELDQECGRDEFRLHEAGGEYEGFEAVVQGFAQQDGHERRDAHNGSGARRFHD